jgi:hypothetical protein
MTPPYRTKPIRFDLDTWLIMRSDPVMPKAVIQRVRHKDGTDRYLLFKWDLDPTKRRLMNVCDTLDNAESLVRYDALPEQDDVHRGPPNGLNADGTRWVRPVS